MRHFEMFNVMGNYLWYENIDGEWKLVADISDVHQAFADAVFINDRSLFNPNTIPNTEIFYK